MFGRSEHRMLVLLALGLAACSGAFGPAIPDGKGSGKPTDAGTDQDSGQVQNAATKILDAGKIRDAASDAFFINDPPPPYCGPDGGTTAPPKIGGTDECPADKNREGCMCSTSGMLASCWPGKRVNRQHGICKDGKTTCRTTPEFGQAWGACEGYVLPVQNAMQGPEACRCFSNGKWTLKNLVPCIHEDESGTYIYSSRMDADTGYQCNAISDVPPPVPDEPWTESTLKVDCAGQFKLCYTIKAGKASEPKSDDCVVMKSCVDVWYDKAEAVQELTDLPGWRAADKACSQRFVKSGGYGEMSVQGKSVECEPVDDGKGQAYVFARTAYCGRDCVDTPDAEGCKGCSVSGMGDF